MAERSAFTAKIDEQVQAQFRDYVQETKGGIRGELGRELENAMIEYMDNDRTARIESKVENNANRLDLLLSELRGSHTHKKSEALEKAEQIVSNLQGEGKVIPEDRVIRAIESVAGIDDRTIEKYRKQLKRQGLAYEHPGSSAVWTLDRTEWFGWSESFLDNNPTMDLNDVIEAYPISHDDYIESVEEIAEGEINV